MREHNRRRGPQVPLRPSGQHGCGPAAGGHAIRLAHEGSSNTWPQPRPWWPRIRTTSASWFATGKTPCCLPLATGTDSPNACGELVLDPGLRQRLGLAASRSIQENGRTWRANARQGGRDGGWAESSGRKLIPDSFDRGRVALNSIAVPDLFPTSSAQLIARVLVAEQTSDRLGHGLGLARGHEQAVPAGVDDLHGAAGHWWR